MPEDRAPVQVSLTTKSRLDERGKKGDTYDEIIKKLLDETEVEK
jgi:hypothetical protein